MKKIIKLTESDLTRIVKRVIKENDEIPVDVILDELNYAIVGEEEDYDEEEEF